MGCGANAGVGLRVGWRVGLHGRWVWSFGGLWWGWIRDRWGRSGRSEVIVGVCGVGDQYRVLLRLES